MSDFSLFCLFVTCKIEDFSSILISRFCYSLSVFVCQSPTGHKFKPTFMKLHQVVEVVSTEKPIDFEVKGQISKIVIFHPIDWKFEQDLHILLHLIWKPTILEVKRSKVNLRSNF